MRLSIADNYFILLLGMAAFLTQLGLLHILRYSKTISILGATLKNSASDVANVLVCIAVLMTGFAGFMHVLYGPHMYDYRSVLATFAAMFSGFLGNFDYQGIGRLAPGAWSPRSASTRRTAGSCSAGARSAGW